MIYKLAYAVYTLAELTLFLVVLGAIANVGWRVSEALVIPALLGNVEVVEQGALVPVADPAYTPDCFIRAPYNPGPEDGKIRVNL